MIRKCYNLANWLMIDCPVYILESKKRDDNSMMHFQQVRTIVFFIQKLSLLMSNSHPFIANDFLIYPNSISTSGLRHRSFRVHLYYGKG